LNAQIANPFGARGRDLITYPQFTGSIWRRFGALPKAVFFRTNDTLSRDARKLSLPRSEIGVFVVELVVFKRDVDILIALGVAPRRAFVDKFVFCTGRSWRTKDGGPFVDLIVVGAINLGNRVSIITPHQQNAQKEKD
jgi:hypothetical protein